MAIALLIAGIDRTGILSANTGPSFSVQVSAKGQATVRTDFMKTGDDVPITGQRLALFDDGFLVFNGVIVKVHKMWTTDYGYFTLSITAMSLEHLLDKRQISPRSYFNKTCKQIIQDLAATVFSTDSGQDEGIGFGSIADGVTIPQIVYDNTPLSDALDDLVARSSTVALAWDWGISPDTSLLNFGPRGTFTAPLTVTNPAILYLTPEFDADQKDLRTRQKIRIDFSGIPAETAYLVGDGTTTVFDQDMHGHPFKLIASIDRIIQTADTFAAANITISSQPANGDTVTIGRVAYTFQNHLDNTNPFLVKIGDDASGTLVNLLSAINDDAPAIKRFGYSLPTYPNLDCMAFFTDDPNTAVIQARYPGAAANGTPLATTSGGISFSSATLDGGVDGAVDTPFQEQSVGITGVDASRDWTYDQGGTSVTAAVAPGAGVAILVTYRALGGDVLAVEDTDAIIARAAVEQSSGVYESTVDAATLSDPVATDALAAIQRIQGMLASFGNDALALVFETKPTDIGGGVFPGQIITVNCTAPFDGDANGIWLVQQVDASYDFDLKHFQYRITCIGRSRSTPTSRVVTTLQFWKQLALLGGRKKSAAGGNAGPPQINGLVAQFIFDALNNGLVVDSTTNLDIQHPNALVWAWMAVAETPSSGGDIIIDITFRDGTSIFDSDKLHIPVGVGDIVGGSNFTSQPMPIPDVTTLQGKVVQGNSGKRVQVKLYGTRAQLPPLGATEGSALPVF